MRRSAFLLAAVGGLATSCAKLNPPVEPVLGPLPEVSGGAGAATQRVNGNVGTVEANLAPQISYGQGEPVTVRQAGQLTGGGDIALDFADTDIREVVAQILGRILRVNYTIDPAVHGTVTLHTTTPLSTNQLLPVLQTLLAQNGATLVRSGGLYQVVTQSAGGPAAPGPPGTAAPGGVGPVTLASGNEVAGGVVVPLRYAGAEDLLKALQPFAGTSAKIIADPGRNALLISGEPASRTALVDLVRAFDIDILAGQSYALLPVRSGDAKDFASAMQDTFRAQKAAPWLVSFAWSLWSASQPCSSSPASPDTWTMPAVCSPWSSGSGVRQCAAGMCITCRTATRTTSPMSCNAPSRRTMSQPSRPRASARPRLGCRTARSGEWGRNWGRRLWRDRRGPVLAAECRAGSGRESAAGP